jgi:hypothetical protein
LFASTFGGGVFCSTNGGLSWQPRNSGLTSTVMGCLSTDLSGRILAGSSDGIFASTDFGTNWTHLHFEFSDYIRSLAVDSVGNIFACRETEMWPDSNIGVHKSTDNGINWSRVLSDPLTHDLARVATNRQGIVFVATFEGVLASYDFGASWMTVNSGLSNTWARSIVLDTRGDVLVGTGQGVFRGSSLTEVQGPREGEMPSRFILSQNYPNPFNPSTTINFALPKSGQVELKIYNTLGQEVASLINEEKSAGTYSAQWNAGNVASGVYFYQLKAGEYSDTKKLLLIK